MKHKLRNKLVTLFLAAASATFLFAGCNNASTESTESVLGENDPLGTTAISDILNQDIPSASDSTVSMLYKEWYDAQEDTDPAPDRVDTAKALLNNLFAVYSDESSQDFIISGHDVVKLDDNDTLTEEQADNLRLESTGERINFVANSSVASLPTVLAEFDALQDTAMKVQPSTFESRVNDESEAEASFTNGTPVYFNNYKTELTYQDGVDLVKLFTTFPTYAKLTTTADSFTFTIRTAAGNRDITFSLASADAFTVSLGDSENTIMSVTAVSTPIESLILKPEDIQTIFGYDTENYNGTLNIVTDNKDLFTELTTLSTDDLAIVTGNLTIKPEEIVDNEPAPGELIGDLTPAVTTDSPEPASTPAYEVEAVFTEDSGTMYCIGNGVNIRESYSTSSNSLGKLAYQDSIEVTGSGFTNGYQWIRINYKGSTAYVVADYFSATKPADKSTTTSSKPSSSEPTTTTSSSSTGTATITMPDGSTAKAELKSDGNVWINGLNYGCQGLGMKVENGVIYWKHPARGWMVWEPDGLANSGGSILVSEDEFVGDDFVNGE